MAKEGSGYRFTAGGGRMSGIVNTSFILDMQLKLYQWSASDKDRTFSDLFNLTCDRRTLIEAWIRLSRNRGGQTPAPMA